MKSKRYIITKLEKLHAKFPVSKINYYHDSFCNIHMIEVFPKSLELSEKFLKEEMNFILEFRNRFEEEGINFSTEAALFPIENPELVWLPNSSNEVSHLSTFKMLENKVDTMPRKKHGNIPL